MLFHAVNAAYDVETGPSLLCVFGVWHYQWKGTVQCDDFAALKTRMHETDSVYCIFQLYSLQYYCKFVIFMCTLKKFHMMNI
jgi:hypothetical protein